MKCTPSLRIKLRQAPILFWTLFLAPFSCALKAQPEIDPSSSDRELLVSNGPSTPAAVAAAREIVNRAYREIGYRVRFETFPLLRGLMELDAGRVDADLARYRSDLHEKFIHLNVVPTPVLNLEISAFMRRGDPRINEGKSWIKLSQTQMRIGGICKIAYIEDKLPTAKVECAQTPESVFKMLLIGRTDVVLMTRVTGLEILASIKDLNEQPGAAVQEIAILSKVPMYHYVNERHASLVPLLDAVFRQQHASGEPDRLIREALIKVGISPQADSSCTDCESKKLTKPGTAKLPK